MRYKKNHLYQNILIGIFVVVIIFLTYSLYQLHKQSAITTLQHDLAQEVVRFHVLAASDSENDQARKLLVKNAVLEYLSEPLAKAESPEEALTILSDNEESIISLAKKVLRENGSDDDVSISIENTWFPVKTYGDITFPAGYYTAFRIIIGEGFGRNWWCVLYPPLCFVDVTHAVLPEESKQMLQNVLTEEEYKELIGPNSPKDSEIQYRFRLFDFLNPS